jgi:cytochrome c peroxidase
MSFLNQRTAFARGGAALLAISSLLGCPGPDQPRSPTLVARATTASGAHELLSSPNASGEAATYSTAGRLDTTGLFFRSVGTNGRSCATCHQASEGWSVTPGGLRQRFDETGGTDPVFRANDGSNAPEADLSTMPARRAAYSMLLTKGLIRVGVGIPAGADFELIAVDDPYHHASARELSLFRRPLPSTNLAFLSAVMWDGRETFKGQTIHFDLDHQALDATTGHAQGSPLTAAEQEEIEAFESGLFTAQSWDDEAGDLTALKARGGPELLAAVPFFIGINDPLGAPGGFNPVAMTAFDSWAFPGNGDPEGRAGARAAVARGQALFNTKPISIEGVRGLNPDGPAIAGTCTTCHNTPEAGDHSVSLPLDLGLTDASRRTPDLPLYTLRDLASGATFRTTDPGRALITGKWADRGRFKGPVLRGLSARAPYFHNGSAATLDEVLDFYASRFGVVFSAGERHDLIAFLHAL